MQSEFDAVIIGGGPAGSSAAMFLARCRWRVLVIERDAALGNLHQLPSVICFPGFPEPISGAELVRRMHKQSELEGVRFVKDSVAALAAENMPARIVTESSAEYTAKAVVVATGAANRTNYLHGEREMLGKGVYYDAVFDAPSVAKKIAAVVGRHRKAAEAALFLSRFAEKVHFIIPANKMDADEETLSRIQKSKNIETYFSTSLKKINGHDHVSSVTLLTAGQEREVSATGVFTFVHDFQKTTGFLGKCVETAEDGSVKIDKNLSTTADGVFACGDVLCARPQVPAVSAAQGIIAGISVDSYLSKL